MIKKLKTVFNGLCMSIVNSVPGISGTTIAMILGFYDDFIGAINDIFYSKARRKHGIFYLLTLGIGWSVGIVSAILVLNVIFEEYVYAICSLFFGVVLCSVPMMIYDEREHLHGKHYKLIYMVLGAALIGWITFASSQNKGSIDMTSFSFGTASTLFFAGIFSTTAMLLPGVSGTTVFLVFGLYKSLMNSLNDIFHFNFKSLPMLLFLLAGSIVGGLGGVKLIRRCLIKHRQATIYASIGMLFGSLYSIMMGPLTLDTPKEWMSPSKMDWRYLLIGAALMVIVQILKLSHERKKLRLSAENTISPEISPNNEEE